MRHSTTGDDVAGLFAGYAASLDVPPASVAEIERRTAGLRDRCRRRSNGIWATSVGAALAVVASCAALPQVAGAAISAESAARAMFGQLLVRGHDTHPYAAARVAQVPPPLRLPQLVPRANLAQVAASVGPDGSPSWTATYRVNGTPRLLVVIERRPGRDAAAQAGGESGLAAVVAGMPAMGQPESFDYRTMLVVRGISITGLSAASDSALLDAVLAALK
jgi:hypothetical protein